MGEAQQNSSQYSNTPLSTQREWFLWAKTSPENHRYHCLIYHMIDVGQVALAIWNRVLPEQTHKMMVDWFNLDAIQTGKLLAYWASLHDIGKAAPGFQRKHPPAIDVLEKSGFVFPDPSVRPARHGAVSTRALKQLLVEEDNLSRKDADMIARAVGGHHGSWPTAIETSITALKRADLGDVIWEEARHSLLKLMKGIFSPPADVCLPQKIEPKNTLLTLVSGLTSAADWIGSMESFFPFNQNPIQPEQYAWQSQQQAEKALYALGWIGWHFTGDVRSFQDLFPGFAEPSQVQKTVIAHAQETSPPALVIVEAPTGSGKTEAALYLSDFWLQSLSGRGLYVAMPTQATSNQMYQRAATFLVQRYPDHKINIHLVHGAALLAQPPGIPAAVIDDEADHHKGGVHAAGWFLPRKRTLLAPFGVGTVDQVLMSVLQTRHFFVRIFGLGQKVVIFDEVHAYDTYMSVLLQQLLKWLRAIGASVILLSATLPHKTRAELADAWSQQAQIELPEQSGSKLTVVTQDKINTYVIPDETVRRINVRNIRPEPFSICHYLKDVLEHGGCAAVIVNRVKRAQEIYQALKAGQIIDPANLTLFHSRFPFAWREEIEKEVLSEFGKNGKRPEKAIVVATQVIEQSLDLDFDLIISDLAPVDLLIQRIGRLHRHSSNQGRRPLTLQEPNFVLAWPDDSTGLPDFGLDVYIYQPSVLLRTWLALREKGQIELPEETTSLIEFVYGNGCNLNNLAPLFRDAILQADAKAEGAHLHEVRQAKTRLIAKPDDEGLITDSNLNLEEDDPHIHRAFRALTRLIEPGIDLVCLFRDQDKLLFEIDNDQSAIDLGQTPDKDEINEILRHTVHVQNWDVLDYYFKQTVPKPWKEIAALKYHHVAIFDDQGHCRLGDTPITLQLSRESGLEIIKEAQ